MAIIMPKFMPKFPPILEKPVKIWYTKDSKLVYKFYIKRIIYCSYNNMDQLEILFLV